MLGDIPIQGIIQTNQAWRLKQYDDASNFWCESRRQEPFAVKQCRENGHYQSKSKGQGNLFTNNQSDN